MLGGEKQCHASRGDKTEETSYCSLQLPSGMLQGGQEHKTPAETKQGMIRYWEMLLTVRVVRCWSRVPEMLQDLHPWGYSELDWAGSEQPSQIFTLDLTFRLVILSGGLEGLSSRDTYTYCVYTIRALYRHIYLLYVYIFNIYTCIYHISKTTVFLSI